MEVLGRQIEFKAFGDIGGGSATDDRLLCAFALFGC
jgi:hypothetical protein